jgi:hypothetical protein
MTAVLVGGALAAKAGNAGEAWVRMSWVRGLLQLGCDVWFAEEVDEVRSDELTWFDSVATDFGLSERSCLVDRSGRAAAGHDLSPLFEFAAGCDLLINISGNLRSRPLLNMCRRRAFVDLDPGYTQKWIEQGVDVGTEGHHLYFSVAEQLGRPGCALPTASLDWLPTRQPVVLSDWPVTQYEGLDRLTTVTTWRAPFGSLDIRGRQFGIKAHEFRKLATLPKRVDAHFEIATEIHPADGADRDLLVSGGWVVVEAAKVAGNTAQFRRFVQGSSAEVSPAQPVYSGTGSGWFSDRSVRYLASGRPVLVQDTGLAQLFPVGEGLLTFTDLDTAAEGARRICTEYSTHAAAARNIAETYFASDVVLKRFLEMAGIG